MHLTETSSSTGRFVELRNVLRVSTPLMLGMGGNLALILVDRISLANYSVETLQASGPAVFTATTLIVLATGTVGISRSFVAQAHGRGDVKATHREAALGTILALIIAVVVLMITPLLVMAPKLSGQPPAIEQLESQYLALSTTFGAVMTLNMALASYFNGTQRTRVPMGVALTGQAVGIVATVSLVFGYGPLPELGMRGAAIGTLIAVTVMFAGYLSFLPASFYHSFARLLRRPVALGAALGLRFRKGIPSGASLGLEELGQTAFVWLAAILGLAALGANNVALSINYAAVIPLIGLGYGCSILSAGAVGADDFSRVWRIIRSTLLIALTYVSIIGFFQVATPHLLLAPFGIGSLDSATADMAAATSRFLWAYAAAFAFSMIGSAVLESVGLARFAFRTRIISMWLICIPAIGLLVWLQAGNGRALPWMWVIFAACEGAMGLACFIRIGRVVKRHENYLQNHHASTDSAASSSESETVVL